MSNYTENYNLKKPLPNEYYNVQDQNDNMDIIDTALKAHDDALATKETPQGAQEKADAALNLAKQYTDQEVGEVAQELAAHKADYATFKSSTNTEIVEIKKKIGIVHNIESWAEVQAIVRAGIADQVFKVGDMLVSEYNGEEVIWTIIGINHDTPTDESRQFSLTIQTRDCLTNCQWDAPEALYYAEEELPAGEHVFTQDVSEIKYKITTTQPIPAGGQIFLSFSDDYDNMTASTYAEDRITVIENGLAVTPTEDSDTLGGVNVRARCRYGSNNYAESNIREWLNSDESNYVWTPKTKFDRPSTGAPYTGPGFLKLLDPELAAVIGKVNKQVARNTLTDGGGQDLFSDKVFLLSRVEAGLGTEGTTDGEEVYSYYDGIENAGRIKLLNGSPRSWWLRSPTVSSAHGARTVSTSGALDNNYAIYSHGLAPACCII